METAFKKLNPSKPVYLYCRSGNRSGKAANLLAKMGFTEIYDLKGGYMSWK
jgi:rhodanese-related sulfurtransferase